MSSLHTWRPAHYDPLSGPAGPPAPKPVRYRLRRLAVWPVMRVGAVAGAIVALVPAGVTALALVWLVRAVHRTLEGWNAVRLPSPVPGLSVPPVSFVGLLHLEALLAAARAWDGAMPLLVVLTVFVVVALGALAGGAAGLIAALLFNAGAALGAGLTVEAEAEALERPGKLGRSELATES